MSPHHTPHVQKSNAIKRHTVAFIFINLISSNIYGTGNINAAINPGTFTAPNDIVIQINGGNGTLGIAYTDNCDLTLCGGACTTGFNWVNGSFSYISGNTYHANLRAAYSNLYNWQQLHPTINYVSFGIYDGGFTHSASTCVPYTCTSSSACTFGTPNPSTLTFNS